MTILHSKEDFRWHKDALDVATRYKHRHYGEPASYPCRVNSVFWDDPNGPYTYNHEFTYQQKVKCACCGHESLVWPDGDKPA